MGAGRGIVWWMFAIAALVSLFLGILPALADLPPSAIVKPVAECHEGRCVMSEADFRLLQEFHEGKFREIALANTLIEEAAEEVAKLRAMLQRYAGGCGEKRRT